LLFGTAWHRKSQMGRKRKEETTNRLVEALVEYCHNRYPLAGRIHTSQNNL
jgi:Mg2+/Co2+ transporter CorC